MRKSVGIFMVKKTIIFGVGFLDISQPRGRVEVAEGRGRVLTAFCCPAERRWARMRREEKRRHATAQRTQRGEERIFQTGLTGWTG
jgi:hypothetical protein